MSDTPRTRVRHVISKCPDSFVLDTLLNWSDMLGTRYGFVSNTRVQSVRTFFCFIYSWTLSQLTRAPQEHPMDTFGHLGTKCNYIKTLRITSFMCSEKIIDIKVGVSLSLLVSIQLSLTSYCLFYFSENTCTNVEYFCGRHNCET